MANAPSPLVGYNNNVRHKGKLYHIQTEDSGVSRPHIMTHLFADGGRIIASKKTEYSHQLAAENLADVVKKLMQEQHKAMAIALRDGVYDEVEPVSSSEPAAPPIVLVQQAPEFDLDFLDRAAEAKLAQSATAQAQKSSAQSSTARDRRSVPPWPAAPPPGKLPSSKLPIRVGDGPGAKSLDEVILSYLADERTDGKR